ncbi:dermonecrotic toxin domain-containing protein [Pseudomonas sp. RA_5y_Pfl1_P24]|uniref:dermonecrotic toxin domain-containing protein n=1 Tax=Pseudomonas sp. RA_5y_Pfl1_P24 TaxID=3088706 RepID=UPI0030DA2233
MASVTPAYFFDEFLRPITRKYPSDRERALGLTLKDLEWLMTIYTPTDAVRQSRESPMAVEKLVIERLGKSAIPLAGVFMMSPSPDEKKALLYSPYGGIEVFDNRATVIAEIRERLTNNILRVDLVSFLSIDQRQDGGFDGTFTLTAAPVTGIVFVDQEQTIEASQKRNVQRMLEELRKLPTLPSMLDKLLGIMARPYFPKLDQQQTLVNSFLVPAQDSGDAVTRWVGSATLNETLLQYYLKQGWPANHTRAFTHPKHDTRAMTANALKQELAQWEHVVEQTAAVFSTLLSSLLQTWWNENIGGNQSRMDLFAQVMSDKFRADLLLKRQNAILTSDEAHRLRAVFLPDKASRSAWHAPLRIEKVSIHAPYQHYVELAATLLISDTHAYLYTQTRGLQVLKNLDDLKDVLLSMLKAAGHEDELLNFLSLDERSLYLGMDAVQVSGLPVAESVFGGMVKDIASKQLSNMDHALALFRRNDGAADLAALLDCALDLRHMLDHRLLALEAEGRWSLHPATSGNGRPSTVQAERAKQQRVALRAAQEALMAQRQKHPTLRSLALHALKTALALHLLDLDPTDVFANTYATEAQQQEDRAPESSRSMVDHLVERLAKVADPVGDSPRIGLYSARRSGTATRWNNLNSRVFNTVIDQAMRPFVQHDIRTLPRLFLEGHRNEMNASLMQGLRSEAELRLLNKTLSPDHQAILDAVLRPDSMTRDKRHGLKGFLPDAYSLTLTLGDDQRAHPLASCFALTQRGGIDPELSGNVVLWTPQQGLEPFASVHALRQSLELRLTQPDRRLPLLLNLPMSLRAPHQVYRLGPLQRIDEHFLNNRQQSYLDYHLDAIDYWLATPLGPTPLQDRLDEQMRQLAPSNLERASAIAQAMVQQQALPVWLGMASAEDQLLHAELLEQYRLSAPDNQDYLHSVPTLREHVASTLTGLLKARFPDAALDPENIQIPASVLLDGHAQSLTDFALRHLPEPNADNLTPTARDTTTLPLALDGTAVVQLVRQLDIAKTYREWLTTHLAADTDDARQRRALFCRQLPWQVLRHAHEEKLEERLSAAAWCLIQQIFDMPDAEARDKVNGAAARIHPLELIATPGATPVTVPCVYVIGPQAPATGPLVLYAPYAPLRVLTEYTNEESLRTQINRPGPLQDWIIRQLGDPDQAIYRNLLRQPAAPDTQEVRLASHPIRRNILPRLFDDNTAQLIKMLACQFERGSKDQWDGVTGLLRRGIPMAAQFIAGKLQFPLVVWRSFKLFQASAEALQQQHFGAGLLRFIQGLGTLASLREELDELLAPLLSPPATDLPDSIPAPVTTIATLDVTNPVRTRMQYFEDVTVSLAQLEQDPSQHVYVTPSGNHYVPVAGRVYPVERAGARWRVRLAQVLGPFVERNAQGGWVLDFSAQEPRFGPAVSRFKGRVVTYRVERSSINIEAVGMPAIRALHPGKAYCIDRALNVAIYYAVMCERNLAVFAQQRDPDSRVGRFLTEMFGIRTLNAAQVTKIQKRVAEITKGLTQQSLIRPDSTRLVTGAARWSPTNTYAFVIPADPEQKIYLLDYFFNTHMDAYRGHLNAPFDLDDHARAATLIHEISHMVSKTEDIAYLDSMRPFADLISRGTADGLRQHTALSNLQRTALSVLTPATMLFKTWDDLSLQWEDVGSLGSTKPRDKILNLTGARTLDDARQIFMSDADRRMDIILANADSVTYLITHLGRKLVQGA